MTSYIMLHYLTLSVYSEILFYIHICPDNLSITALVSPLLTNMTCINDVVSPPSEEVLIESIVCELVFEN